MAEGGYMNKHKTPAEVIKWLDSLKINYLHDGEYMRAAKMYLSTYEQVMWERDIAISKLAELGQKT